MSPADSPGGTVAVTELYLSLGWRPVPVWWPIDAGTDHVRCGCGNPDCQKIGKHPLMRGWLSGDRPSLDTVRRWLHEWPHMNLGVATGPASGIAVLDVDPRNGGVDSLSQLVGRFGELPATLTAQTGGGGSHLVYAHPGRKVASRAGALGPGLDIKADGGQIVVAPSLHASGQRYRWVTGQPPAPWPTVLNPLLPRPPRPPARAYVRGGRAALRGLVRHVLTAAEGQRNSRLYWAGCRAAEHVAGGRLPEAPARRALELAAERTGLDDREIDATISSAWKAAAT